MAAACKHCGGPTTVLDDAGVVCILCAEIAEPNRVVLASELEYPFSTTYDGWIPVAPQTVKTGRNRYLSGQGKEVRDSKNLVRSFLPGLLHLLNRSFVGRHAPFH